MAKPTKAQKLDYEEWRDHQTFDKPDTKQCKAELVNELQFINELRGINDEETQKGPKHGDDYQLWLKWDELNNVYPDPSDEELKRIRAVKRKIWRPKEPEDYRKLEPELVFAKSQFPIMAVSVWGQERFEFASNPDPISEDWTILRYFLATMVHGGNVGRSLRFIVRDRVTKKYLGIICVSGDFFDLKGRDDQIGWSNKQKVDNGMINHTAIGSVIIPVQPFGYNYVGGKLMALMCLSNKIAEMWEDHYNNKLVGFTTTSLYGITDKGTQYSGMKPYLMSCGETTGTTPYKLSKQTNQKLREWLRNAHPYEYWQFHVAQRPNGLPLVRDANARSLQFCYTKLGIEKKLTESKQSRGIYFSGYYTNTGEFLRQEITAEQLKPRIDNSTENLVNVWRQKHARKRIASRIKKKSFSHQGSFYDELLGVSWKQALDQSRSR